MAITKEKLQQLVAVQEQDLVLDKLQEQMALIPEEIAALREGVEAAQARLNEARARLLTLEKKRKEKELDLAAKEDAIRKHSMELNQVKTNEAFKALQAQIDQAKASGSNIETEILEAMEAIDLCRREEKAVAAELKASQAQAESAIATLERGLAELKAKFDAQKAARDQGAIGVPAQMLRIYDHVRSRGKPDAIVPVDGENCSACRINLAPQMIIEVTKAKALVICESCQRILYKPEPAAKAA